MTLRCVILMPNPGLVFIYFFIMLPCYKLNSPQRQDSEPCFFGEEIHQGSEVNEDDLYIRFVLSIDLETASVLCTPV